MSYKRQINILLGIIMINKKTKELRKNKNNTRNFFFM